MTKNTQKIKKHLKMETIKIAKKLRLKLENV